MKILGDVQRLANGNTIIAYGTKSELHEKEANATRLQDLVEPLSPTFGYIQKRATLYGPPPRSADPVK